ncbi:hypothetical protein P9112_001579 [Eukaryota sp. TZLM1-RC]
MFNFFCFKFNQRRESLPQSLFSVLLLYSSCCLIHIIILRILCHICHSIQTQESNKTSLLILHYQNLHLNPSPITVSQYIWFALMNTVHSISLIGSKYGLYNPLSILRRFTSMCLEIQ